MCQNSGVQSAQFSEIDKFVEQGIMPQKIVKTVKYVLKKRVEEERKGCPFAQTRVAMLESKNTYNQDIPPSKTACACATNATDITELPEVGDDLQKISKQCGCARQLQNSPNNISKLCSSENNENGYVDALAVGTQLTRRLAQRLGRDLAKFQNSKVYTIFKRTTQPAHVIAICILSFVLLTLWPDLIDSTGGDNSAKTAAMAGTATAARKSHTLAVIAYLGAFATHFGAQIWMTFVSGLSLYFSLPRHTFGQCQQILFPKYFALNAVLSISMLILFVKYFLPSGWNTSICVQLLALALTAMIEVTVRLYLAPPMLRLMHEKYRIEDAIGSGQEVGNLVQGDLVQCPHYQRIHKAFRRIHMTIAIGNIVSLLATCWHLYFLASKIHIN